MTFNIGDSVTLKSDSQPRRGIVTAYNRKGKVFVRWFDKGKTVSVEKETDLLPVDVAWGTASPMATKEGQS